MEVSTARDIIIVILGILYIILTIGIIVGLIFVYLKLKHLISSINRTLIKVQKWLAYVRGLAKGLSESVNVFKKGGI
jgi:hypothetical protein